MGTGVTPPLLGKVKEEKFQFLPPKNKNRCSDSDYELKNLCHNTNSNIYIWHMVLSRLTSPKKLDPPSEKSRFILVYDKKYGCFCFSCTPRLTELLKK